MFNACYAWRGDASPRTLKGWSLKLREVSAALSDLGRRTEGEFLSVGENLREVHARAKAVSEKASSAAALASGAEIVSAIEGLRAMVGRMNVFLSRSGSEAARNEEALRRVGRILGEVRAPLMEFKKVVRSLRVLGVSTKIESARLGQRSGDFRTLAESVGNLATLIESKSDNLVERATDLDTSIGDTLSRVLDHEAALRERARAILADASNSLAALVDAQGKGAETAKAVSDRSSGISGDIGAVVTSMQFHDITRQQIEHVVDAFADLDRKIAAVSGVWPGAPGGPEEGRRAGGTSARSRPPTSTTLEKVSRPRSTTSSGAFGGSLAARTASPGMQAGWRARST